MTRQESIRFPPLSVVELAMAIEETFRLEIPDAHAEHITTIGQLKTYVWDRVQHSSEEQCFTQQAFYRIRRAICDVLHVEPARIRPCTLWNEILPRHGRRKAWKAICAAGEIPLLPARSRAPIELYLVVLIWAGLAWGLCAGLLDLRGAEGVLVPALGLLGGLWLLQLSKGGSSSRLPRYRTKVGDAAKLVVAMSDPPGSRDGPWTFDEVARTIDKLTLEITGTGDFNDTAGICD